MLRPKVFDLLIHLARNRERVVPRDELIRADFGARHDRRSGLASRGWSTNFVTALGERGGIELLDSGRFMRAVISSSRRFGKNLDEEHVDWRSFD